MKQKNHNPALLYASGAVAAGLFMAAAIPAMPLFAAEEQPAAVEQSAETTETIETAEPLETENSPAEETQDEP